MAFPIKDLNEVERFVLAQLPRHPNDIARFTAEHFKISRQAVSRHIRHLIQEGFLTPTGATRQRQYGFAMLATANVHLRVSSDLAEDRVWAEHVYPLLTDVPSNVLDICRYGVTEIVNNAIEHSGSQDFNVVVNYTAPNINIMIVDRGVGIFRKIKEAYSLDDERHAILELTKGKVTTDPDRHTGKGIFFTSRMFDHFGILSGVLWVGCSRGAGDWLLENRTDPRPGTSVHLDLSPFSPHTTAEVFDHYATEQEDYAFGRTHIVVALAQQTQPGEKLVSRSQARRIMSRLDRFKKVVLNFRGVDEIGPAFSDEIFRVFANQHPNTHVMPMNENDSVGRMVRRALTLRDNGVPPKENGATDIS